MKNSKDMKLRPEARPAQHGHKRLNIERAEDEDDLDFADVDEPVDYIETEEEEDSDIAASGFSSEAPRKSSNP